MRKASEINGKFVISIIEGDSLVSKKRTEKFHPFTRIWTVENGGKVLKYVSATSDGKNPKWEENKFEDWIFNSESVELFVEVVSPSTFRKDKIIGSTRVSYHTLLDCNKNDWFDLKDKRGNGVGKLLIGLDVKYTANLPAAHNTFDKNSVVIINQSCSTDNIKYEVFGNVDSLNILRLCKGLEDFEPPFSFKNHGVHSNWSFSFKQGILSNNSLISLMENLSEEGFEVKRSSSDYNWTDPDGNVLRKSPQNYITMRNNGNSDDKNKLKYLIMDLNWDNVGIRLLGKFDEDKMDEILVNFNSTKLIDNLTARCHGYLIVPDNKSNKRVLSLTNEKIFNNVHQNLSLKIISTLLYYNFKHVTNHKSGHIFTYRDSQEVEKFQCNPIMNINSDVVLPTNKLKYIRIQGDILIDDISEVASAFNSTAESTFNSKSKDYDGWKFEIPENQSKNDSNTRIKRYLNSVVKTMDQFSLIGYSFLSMNDIEDMLLQKNGDSDLIDRNSGGNYLFLRVSRKNKQLEIQGKIEDQQLNSMVEGIGFDNISKVIEPDGTFLEWNLKLPSKSGKSPIKLNHGRRKIDRVDSMLLDTITSMSRFGYHVVSSFGYYGPLILKYDANNYPVSYVLFYISSDAIGFQGDLELEQLNEFSTKLQLDQVIQDIDRNHQTIGWLMKYPPGYYRDNFTVLSQCMELLENSGYSFQFRWCGKYLFQKKVVDE